MHLGISALLIIVAVVFFLLDLIIVLAIPAAPPQLVQVFLYGGLAAFAAGHLSVP